MKPISQISLYNSEPPGKLSAALGMTVMPAATLTSANVREARHQTHMTQGSSDNASAQFESFEWDASRQRRRLPLRSFDPTRLTTPAFVPDNVHVATLRAPLPGPTWPIAIPPRLMSPIRTGSFVDAVLQREASRRLSQQTMFMKKLTPTSEPTMQRTTLPIQTPSSTQEDSRASAEEIDYVSTEAIGNASKGKDGRNSTETGTETQTETKTQIETMRNVARLRTPRPIVIQSSVIFPLGNPFWIFLDRYNAGYSARHDAGRISGYTSNFSLTRDPQPLPTIQPTKACVPK